MKEKILFLLSIIMIISGCISEELQIDFNASSIENFEILSALLIFATCAVFHCLTSIKNIMRRLVLYLFLVALVSCNTEESKSSNPYYELLADYVFHDDVYMTRRTPFPMKRSVDDYYIITSDGLLENTLRILSEKAFVVSDGPRKYYYGTSDETVLSSFPSRFHNSYELSVKGYGDISDIPDLLYCGPLYFEQSPSQLLYQSCSIAIDIQSGQEKAFVDLLELLNVAFIGPWVQDNNDQRYILICTTDSIANCVEIYNCLFEIGGYSDMYIIQPDDCQPTGL